MQCFTELVPPTAVTHSICFPFLSSNSNNLIVAKTSLLQIFSLKNVTTEVDTSSHDESSVTDRRLLDDDGLEQSFLAADVTLQRAERTINTKLKLVAEYTLPGTVTSLARVKILNSKSGGEALLVATRDAKLSLVEWDHEHNGMSTISIHYYEHEDLQGSPWAPDLSQCVSYLTADPSSRCAALKFGARSLAILPFHQPGDDLVMDDFDGSPDTEMEDGTEQDPKATNGDITKAQTPYSSSFVLPLSALDSSLIHPIHLSFLYEYREPTFGVLSSSLAASTSLLHERRDLISYTVFTLDLEQRASTTILSVTNLPYDLHKVIPLPTPVGGTLLVGGNELIHVDQAGKTNGVAVNLFAKLSSSFSMADQSDLKMKLEGCVIEQLGVDNGEMLMILNTGELAIVSFKLDGRSISGLSVRRVSAVNGGMALKAGASCSANLGRGRIFFGSEEMDSVVLGWSRGSKQTTKHKATTAEEGLGDESFFDEDEADDNDDDLYAEATNDDEKKAAVSASAASKAGEYAFRIQASLMNLAPATDVTLGRPRPVLENEGEPANQDPSSLELAITSGRGKAGGVSFLRREIDPQVIGRFDFPEAHGVWSVQLKRPTAKSGTSRADAEQEREYDPADEFDRYMIVSRSTAEGGEESAVYSVNATGFEEMKGTEFEPEAGGTVEVGTLGGGKRMVQVLRGEVRSYDGNLGLSQIFPMTDELTGAEPRVVSASFASPYALLVRDDASVLILQCDENGDLEEVERGDSLLATKWVSGCLYEDNDGGFTHILVKGGEKQKKVAMFLLSAEGGLHIYDFPNLNTAYYVADSLSSLPPIVSSNYIDHHANGARRSMADNRETIMEIIVAELGDTVAKSAHLIVRSSTDDLTIYQPFYTFYTDLTMPVVSRLRLLKLPSPHLARSLRAAAEPVDTEQDEMNKRNQPLRAIANIGGYSTVFLPGRSPSFVLKSATSIPRVLGLKGKGVRGMSGFNTLGCSAGWVAVDDEGAVRVSQFAKDVDLTETGWAVRRISTGRQVDAITYHAETSCYVLAVSEPVPYTIPKDDKDPHPEKMEEDPTDLPPTVPQSTLLLLSTLDWSIIDTFHLQPLENVLALRTLALVTSEHRPSVLTPLITVGTSTPPAPSSPQLGRIYILSIIPCVPHPDRPSTDRRLKLIANEEVKGAVTALSAIGTQGFLMVGQGQKVLVRGLKEDGSLLPVAFMDVGTHVSALTCLPGTGMCVVADATKGVWVVGYTEEPYKMLLFGRSAARLEVLAASFLPAADQLFVVVADAEGNLHTLQFDPEHPKSLAGTRLLHHSSLATPPSPHPTLTLLPSSRGYYILHTSAAAQISLLTPLAEPAYRRLAALSNLLVSALDWPLGLNPRAFRVATAGAGGVGADIGVGFGTGGGGGRGTVDGGVVGRWMELGVQKRAELAVRVGAAEEEIRADLAAVGGLGLGYL